MFVTNISAIIQFVHAFQKQFQITWLIILQNEETVCVKNLVNGLRKISNFTYVSTYDLRTFTEVAESQFFYQTIMVLSLYPTWIRNNSLQTWFWSAVNFKMPQFFWLTIADEIDYFKNVYIPFDCDFLIAQMIELNHYKTFEIYKTNYNSNLYNSDFGTWSGENGLSLSESNFDLRRNNLHGQELLVFNENEKDLPDDWFSVSAAAIYAHACRDIGKRLNAKITFTGNENDPFDVNVVPNRILPGQSLGPVFIFRYDIFFKAPSRSFSWVNYLKPYSTPFWTVMILTALHWLFILIVIYKALSYVYPISANKIRKGDSILKIIAADTTDKSPTYISAMIIFTFRVVARFLLQNAYSAIFMSFVTVIILKPPFTTLQEIADNGNYKILALPSRSYLYYELAVEDEAIRILKEKHLLPKDQQAYTYQEAFDRLCYSGENYVTDFPAKLANEIRLRMKRCRISDVTIKLIYGAGSWFTKENSSFRRALNFWTLRLIEAGTMDPMIWSRSSSLRQYNPKTITRPIDIIDCGFLLIVYALGLCISIIIYNLEKFYHRLVKAKYERLKMQRVIAKWTGQPFLK